MQRQISRTEKGIDVMKKLFAMALMMAILISCGVYANAADSSPPPVADIEVVWNEEIRFIYHRAMEPYFGPETVDLTLFYKDGSQKTLEEWYYSEGDWWERGTGWWREIDYFYDDIASTVTFYYVDSDLWPKGPIEWSDAEWKTWRAALPQQTIDVSPLHKTYIESQQPLTRLKPEGSISVTFTEAWDRKAYALTPKEDGLYCIYTEKFFYTPLYDAVLFDESMEIVAKGEILTAKEQSDDQLEWSGLVVSLKAGKTYYLVVEPASDCEFDIVVTSKVRKVGVGQWIRALFTYGLSRQHRVWHNATLYSVHEDGPLTGTLQHNHLDVWMMLLLHGGSFPLCLRRVLSVLSTTYFRFIYPKTMLS